MQPQRHFTSGSRPAPDPIDQFLESHGFYRKHTARDPSSLFRVISEQLYDTQLHHMEIRRRCVEYMRKHKRFFHKYIRGNYNSYLDELSKPKTHASFVELRAVAYIYERNIILFEAFETGYWFICEKRFESFFQVFYAPERHFDSIFSMEYMTSAGICQSIAYEILYKNVFKLPDVHYAVEAMLYSNQSIIKEIVRDKTGEYDSEVILEDGRVFTLDKPENTECVLENCLLCSFHNNKFEEFAQDLECDNQNFNGVNRTLSRTLPLKYMSCVRQLLHEGITPFPYKVAKALDPYMYKNIEFDTWSEMRKEHFLRVAISRNNQAANGGYPADKIIPWKPSQRSQKFTETAFFRKSSQGIVLENEKNEKITETISEFEMVSVLKKELYIDDADCLKRHDNFEFNELAQFHHFAPPSYEYITAPLSTETCLNSDGAAKGNRNNNDPNQIEAQKYETDTNNNCGDCTEYASTRENYPYDGYYTDAVSPYPYDRSIPPPAYMSANQQVYSGFSPIIYPNPSSNIPPPGYFVPFPPVVSHVPNYPPPYYAMPGLGPNVNSFSVPSGPNHRYNSSVGIGERFTHRQTTPMTTHSHDVSHYLPCHFYCAPGQEGSMKNSNHESSREHFPNEDKNHENTFEQLLNEDFGPIKTESEQPPQQSQIKRETSPNPQSAYPKKRVYSRFFSSKRDKRYPPQPNRHDRSFDDAPKSNNTQLPNSKSNANWNSRLGSSNTKSGGRVDQQNSECNTTRSTTASADISVNSVTPTVMYSPFTPQLQLTAQHPPPIQPSCFAQYGPMDAEGGFMVQQPIVPLPFGSYSVPPPGLPPPPYSAYLTPPPNPIQVPPSNITSQPYVSHPASSSLDPSMTPYTQSVDSSDSNYFMINNPVYYSPSGVPTTPLPLASGGQSAPGFWVTTPVHQPQTTHPYSGGFSIHNNASFSSNNLSR